MNDFWFVTFGDSRLEEARERIRRQAEKMGVFGDRIRIFNERDLDADFCERMKEHLIPGSRGFGYWSWKPQVILQVLKEMPEGDVLLYADIGSHLNPKGLRRLNEYRQYALDKGVVAFQSRALGAQAITDFGLHFLPERQWTKMDLLQHFGVVDNRDILDSGQVGASVILVSNNSNMRNLIGQWRECFYSHFELTDDSPSAIPEMPDFIENRYDQSVFSLICKRNDVCLLSSGEYVHIRCYMPEDGDKNLWPEYWRELEYYPIHLRRDLGKFTKVMECPDWLKPFLGKVGRRLASRMYECMKPIVNFAIGRRRIEGVRLK